MDAMEEPKSAPLLSVGPPFELWEILTGAGLVFTVPSLFMNRTCTEPWPVPPVPPVPSPGAPTAMSAMPSLSRSPMDAMEEPKSAPTMPVIGNNVLMLEPAVPSPGACDTGVYVTLNV